MDIRKTVRNYLKSWFLPDLLVLLADWLNVVAPVYSTDYVTIFRTLRVVRLIRLSRFVKLGHLVTILVDRIASEYCQTLLELPKLGIALILIIHIVASFWYMVAIGESPDAQLWKKDHNWVTQNHLEETPWYDRYLYSLHWTVAQFTPAPNNIFPVTFRERLFAVMVCFFGFCLFTCFLGSLTGTLTQLRSLKNLETKQLWIARRFFRERKVEAILASQLSSYLRQKSLTRKKSLLRNEIKIFELLPDSLLAELALNTSLPAMRIHPVFARVEGWHTLMTQVVTEAISERRLATDEVVFLPAESAEHMYFVNSGRLTYILSDRSTYFNDACRNEYVAYANECWISEQAIWLNEWSHCGVLTAEEDAIVLRLGTDNFHKVCGRFSDVYNLMRRFATQLVASWTSDEKQFHDLTYEQDKIDEVARIFHEIDSPQVSKRAISNFRQAKTTPFGRSNSRIPKLLFGPSNSRTGESFSPWIPG